MSHPSVAHVLWNGRIGGIERLVHDLAIEQLNTGVDVTVAFGQATGHFAGVLQAAGVHVVDLQLRSGFDVRVARLSSSARLLAESDVVHLHGFNPPMAGVAARAGACIVYTDHGVARRDDFRLTDPLKRWLTGRFMHRSPDAIAANSRYSAARVSARYGVPARDITVVHNGIAEIDGVRIRERRGEGIVAAFVGRLVGLKRVDRILDALPHVGESASVRLLVVGGGPLDRELRARVENLGIADRVSFLGYREDVAEILADTDVLIQPSAGEAFGLAIVEGCAQGALPIVFADGGGALEVLPPDGVVVDGVDLLAQTLRDIPASPALAEPARARRAAWAREKFSIAKTAQKYGELYERALAWRGARE